MKKRFLSVFLAVLMVISTAGTFAIGTSAADPFTLTVKCGDIQADGNVKVEVDLANNPGVAGIEFQLNFDNTKVQLVSYDLNDDGEVDSIFTEPTLNLQESGVDYKKLSKVAYIYATKANKTQEGKLIGLTFKVIGDFESTDVTIDAGYKITNKDFEDLVPVIVNGRIALPEITGVTLADGEFTYDGTAKSIKVAGATDQTVVYTGNGQKNAGNYDVVATVKKAGFQTLTLKAKLNITPKDVTVTGLKANDKVYDKTNAVTLDTSAVKLNGLVDGDDYNVEFTNGTTADVDAGSNKAVTLADPTVSGASKGNYKLTLPTVTVNVSKLTLNVTPDAGQGKKVGGTDPAITYTTDNTAFNSTLTGALAREAGEDGGEISKTYKITMGTLATSDKNITLVLKDECFTIFNKDPQNVSFNTINEMTYDDSDFDLAAVVNKGTTNAIQITSSDNGVISVTDGKLKVVGVGTAKITVKVDGDDTYAAFEKSFNVVVKPKKVTVTATAADITYGSTPVFNKTYSETISVTGELALDSKNVGSRLIVIGTLKPVSKNYELVLNSTPAYVTVNKKVVKLSGVETFVAVDGTTPVIKTFNPVVAPSEIVAGDTVNVNPGSNYSVVKSGSDYVVAPLTLSNDNYELDARINVTFGTKEQSAQSAFHYYNNSNITYDNSVNYLDVALPSGMTISIKNSDNTSVIALDGTVTPAKEDTEVNVTIEMFYNGVSTGVTKTYKVTVLGEGSDGRNLVLLWLLKNQNKTKNTVSAVSANVATGTKVPAGTKVELSTETLGATIYYTTDGTNPTVLSTAYTAPIEIKADTTIKAFAAKNGMTESTVVTFTYVVDDTTIALKADAATIKYMDGKDGKFAPNDAATRYEVVKALANVFDIKTSSKATDLKDIEDDSKEIVDLFTAAGIINGYTDNTFRGTKTITRAEFCKIVCVMLHLDVENAKDGGFNDVAGHWAVKYINACANANYVNGKGEGKFAPNVNITRAEVVTLINRITGAKAGTECSYKDVVSGAWYFGAVAAAAK